MLNAGNAVNYVPKSDAELRNLITKAKSGDHVSYEIVAHEGLRLTIAIAEKYQEYGKGLEEMVSEGFKGWTRGYQIYDPQKEHRFPVYVSWWIKEAINRIFGIVDEL